MKTIIRLAILPALLLALTSAAHATTINLGSYTANVGSSGFTGGTTEASTGFSNTALVYQGYSATFSTTAPSGSAAAYDVTPKPSWADSLAGTAWVSNSAAGGPPSGDTADSAVGYYYYETTFSATTAYTGTISIEADDTAEVLLNGNVLVSLDALGTDAHCAQFGSPSCGTYGSVSNSSSAWVATVSIPSSDLVNGTNTLEIIDEQGLKYTPAGIDFSAELTATNPPPAVPEPSSLTLLGSGLLGLAFFLFRKANGLTMGA